MYTITDTTAGSQRFAIDNAGNTELGSATPSSKLSVNGHTILAGTMLAQATAAPPSMPRITGSISVAAGNVATVTIPATSSAFSSVAGSGLVVGYSSDRTHMTLSCTLASGSATLNYGSF